MALPPIVFQTPDLIGKRVQAEQENAKMQFQMAQMQERAEERRANKAQSYINRSLSTYERGQMTKLTDPTYLAKAQDAYYAWQDAGTEYYANPTAANKQQLDAMADSYRQTTGVLLAYNQEENKTLSEVYTNPSGFRTSYAEAQQAVRARREAIGALGVGEPIPMGMSLAGQVIPNDDIKPFDFTGEGATIAKRTQDKINGNPSKYLVNGQLNIELINREIAEEVKFTLTQGGQMPAITIAAKNHRMNSPSISEYKERAATQDGWHEENMQQAEGELASFVKGLLYVPEDKPSEADKERNFPKKYASLSSYDVTINGQQGQAQTFSGNMAIAVAVPGAAPKYITGRAMIGGKLYVAEIPRTKLEMWQEGYEEGVNATWRPATDADKAAMKQELVGYYNQGPFAGGGSSKQTPSKPVSSQSKSNDPLGLGIK